MAEILAMWTNPDGDARRAVIQTHFHESVHFYNTRGGGEFIGHAGLEAVSDAFRSRFPGAHFTLAQPPQTLANAIRAYWQIGPPDNPGAASGMDFVILQGSKVSALYAFVDETS
jgi:hypothetical protein